LYFDVLIFAIVAAFLIYRLNSVLGTRHGDERQRPNPFAAPDAQRPVPVSVQAQAMPRPKAATPLAGMDKVIDVTADKDGRIAQGLAEISTADSGFDVSGFMHGARYAFEMIVMAYAKGDLAELKSLVSPKLYADFEAGVKAREAAGHKTDLTIHRIKAARIVEAHLGGTMAYITVDYDVEETSVTRDATGNIVDGNPDNISSVEDIWTFTRDIRSSDPNWILIETRAAEK
jgi:predicted lipid-binding transport protein (Tim44 family)